MTNNAGNGTTKVEEKKDAGHETEKRKFEKIKPGKDSKIIRDIEKIVGDDRLSYDDFHKILYSHDVAPLPKMMSIMFKFTPDLIVKPRNGKDVSRIMKLASRNGIPVVPRGGGTWGLGGAVPTNGGILLDMGSMNNILEVDAENLTITVEPGVTWKEVDEMATSKNLFLGAYPSSAPGASVGGWINTGGIGIGSYKYGGVDQQVRNMEVVLPDGKIIETGFNKVMSNSSGYNLNGLFMGSEGTLGVITKVTLKVHPGPEIVRPNSYIFKELKQLPKALFELTRTRISPWHITIVDKKHLEFLRKTGIDTPNVGGMLNITLEGSKTIVDHEENVLDQIMEKYSGRKASGEFSEHEWDERYYELRAKPLGPTALVGEVFIPVNRLAHMIIGTNKIIRRMKIRAAIVGMVSDRNTIVLMPYVLTDERHMIKSLATMAFIKKIGDLSFKLGGRPAGLGTFFSVNLKKMHGKGIDTICDIKSSIDPYDIMNPGKLTEGVTRFGFPIPAFGFNLGMNAMAVVKGMMSKDK